MLNLDSPGRVIDAVKAGEPVVMLNDDGPNAGGDLFIPAVLATVSNVAFLIRYGCGYLRAAVTPQISTRLEIPPMRCGRFGVPTSTLPYLVSVDAAHGITTGISAADRARTLQILADPESAPDELSRPGHLVVAQANRHHRKAHYGATEAAVDLAHAARLPPTGALCGLTSQNDETRMAARPELLAFANRHRLPSTSYERINLYVTSLETRSCPHLAGRRPTAI